MKSLHYIMLIILLILTGSASAHSGPVENYTCQSGEIGVYAHYSFCLPPGVAVRQDVTPEGSYAGGREAWTSLWLNDRKAQIHMIYPCGGIGSWQSPAGIQARLEEFNPSMKGSALYSTDPMQIDGHPAVWGSWEHLGVDQVFAAYQPSIKCIAAVFFSADVPADVRSAFLGTLRISVNEAASPLRPWDCEEKVEKVVVYYRDDYSHHWPDDGWPDNYSPDNDMPDNDIPDNNSPFYMDHRERMEELDDIGRWVSEESAAIRERVFGGDGSSFGPDPFVGPISPFTSFQPETISDPAPEENME